MITKNFDLNAALLKAKFEASKEVDALNDYIYMHERSDDFFYGSSGYKAARGELSSLRESIRDLEELL